MKGYILIILALFSFRISAQEKTDYSLARSGEYTLGVYIFIYSTPINEYDYVGKIDKIDFTKVDSKEIEKIITKARKKNAFFDGMIVKKDYDYIELIKFKTKEESVASYKVDQKVQYEAYGKLIIGEIVDIDDARKKVTVKYTDAEGNE
ncbi:MAG: hypothetical protein ABI207_04550, partial [Crocinitomicaceae bacterium]